MPATMTLRSAKGTHLPHGLRAHSARLVVTDNWQYVMLSAGTSIFAAIKSRSSYSRVTLVEGAEYFPCHVVGRPIQ